MAWNFFAVLSEMQMLIKVALSRCVVFLQIGDLRGVGGLLELAWHQLKIKLGVYNVKVKLRSHLQSQSTFDQGTADWVANLWLRYKFVHLCTDILVLVCRMAFRQQIQL